MTIRKLDLGCATRVALWAVAIAIAGPAFGAEPTATERGAVKPAVPAKKATETAAAAAKPTPAATTKAKPRTRRGAKAGKTTTASAAVTEQTADAKPEAAAEPGAAKPTQVVDFDGDEVDGHRMEPGFELIQGAPRRARQPSLVTPLRPEDSVVRRE